MKKLTVVLLVLGLFVFSTSNASARAIGVKINYNSMMGDYSDAEFENNLFGGLFFEVGKWGFESLTFRPGIDFVTLENEYDKWATVIGLHADWYWFFMERKQFAPFIGFGPTFNYFLMNSDYAEDDDSDVGIEGFGGCEFEVANNIALMGELRLVFHDIANIGQQIFKISFGVVFYI